VVTTEIGKSSSFLLLVVVFGGCFGGGWIQRATFQHVAPKLPQQLYFFAI
jgi:DNA-binding transcriptional regulator of glucitol operon